MLHRRPPQNPVVTTAIIYSFSIVCSMAGVGMDLAGLGCKLHLGLSHMSPTLLGSAGLLGMFSSFSHRSTRGPVRCRSTFEAPAHVIADQIPPVTANHVDKPQVKGQRSVVCPPRSQNKSNSQAQNQ